MTLIHASGMPARGRLEESTALQKRLLQDLERQWLDSWGQADQAQAQAVAPDDKPVPPADAAAPLASQGGARLELPSPPGMSGARQIPMTGPAPEANSLSVVASPTSALSIHGLGSSEPANGDAEPRAMTAAVAAPVTEDAMCLVRSAAAEAENADVRPVALAMPGSCSEPDSSGHGKVLQAGGEGGLAGAVAASTPGSIEPEVGTEVSPRAGQAGAKPLATAALSMRRPLPLGAAREAGETAARSPTRRLPVAGDALKPAPQHLMLREIREQEVLASMRDAKLGSHESQLAAQGLARALMQAGYARVHVVVNGQQQSHGALAEPEAAATGADLGSEATASESTNTPRIDHGHQR